MRSRTHVILLLTVTLSCRIEGSIWHVRRSDKHQNRLLHGILLLFISLYSMSLWLALICVRIPRYCRLHNPKSHVAGFLSQNLYPDESVAECCYAARAKFVKYYHIIRLQAIHAALRLYSVYSNDFFWTCKTSGNLDLRIQVSNAVYST